LNEALANAIAAQHPDKGANAPQSDADGMATSALVADLRRRLTSEIRIRERAERNLQKAKQDRDVERRQRQDLEQRERALLREVECAEIALKQLLPDSETPEEAQPDLGGMTLLYVGGRAHQVAQLRELAEQANAVLLHHDGGIDDRSGLLEAQVARADLTMFPVDCVSHNAVAVAKRVSRTNGKPYLALRSSGLTSFAATLRSIAGEQSSDTKRAVAHP
jgi:hypothetical protein